MTLHTLGRHDVAPPDTPAPSTSLRTVLLSIILVAVLAIAVAGGFFWGSRSDSAPGALPSSSSVDAGFARDMATHHQQAVTMAGYVRDNPSNQAVANLAYDIETAQSVEMGAMTGWLATWGVSRTSGTPMSWMSIRPTTRPSAP